MCAQAASDSFELGNAFGADVAAGPARTTILDPKKVAANPVQSWISDRNRSEVIPIPLVACAIDEPFNQVGNFSGASPNTHELTP